MRCAVFPIHKHFVKLIFSGEKDIEFRRFRTKLNAGDKIYIYETKKNGGAGMVVGAVTLKEIKPIPFSKLGAYSMIGHYVEKYGTEEEKEVVKSALEVEIDKMDNCAILRYMYDKEFVEHIKQTSQWERYMCFRKNPSNEEKLEQDKWRKMADDLVDRCDDWLTKIGYYNCEGESTWKYQFVIDSVKQFDVPIPVSRFETERGKTVTRAPQGFCYVKEI